LQVIFLNKNIETLYKVGKNRKYSLQPQVLKKFFMRIQQLEAALTVYDLWNTPSIQFEKMQGHTNKYSLRIDGSWRLEMEIDWQKNDKTTGIFNILEISKHYGD
jgi:proteic killer suppression protein